jgi:SET domain/AWS domain
MARFHELALLCHKDASRFKLPHLDPSTSIQERLERKASEKFGDYKTKRQRTIAVKGENKFFPGIKGDKLTKPETELVEAIKKRQGSSDSVGSSLENGSTTGSRVDLTLTEGFCLPCTVQSEVYSVPPQYRHVTANQIDPNNRPPKVSLGSEMCQCVNFCGDDCLNRMLYVECFGSGDRGAGNCRVGPKCGNRVVTQRKLAKCKPQREQGKGWGLVTLQMILQGDFVQEYVGEVIHEKEKEERLSDWSKLRPNDHNFYVMSLCPDWYVDARLQGNLARFINHSCDPNCLLLQINVGGYMRCGIFAKRNIHPGEFLSYDYNFDTRSDQFVCRCGALRCRGNMKSTAPKNSAVIEKSKAEAWDEAKAKYDRDRKFLTDHFETEAKRCNLVGPLVPDAEGPLEIVSNGVQARYRSEVLRSRAFLWRNAVRGSDFDNRLVRAERRRKEGQLVVASHHSH